MKILKNYVSVKLLGFSVHVMVLDLAIEIFPHVTFNSLQTRLITLRCSLSPFELLSPQRFGLCSTFKVTECPLSSSWRILLVLICKSCSSILLLSSIVLWWDFDLSCLSASFSCSLENNLQVTISLAAVPLFKITTSIPFSSPSLRASWGVISPSLLLSSLISKIFDVDFIKLLSNLRSLRRSPSFRVESHLCANPCIKGHDFLQYSWLKIVQCLQ